MLLMLMMIEVAGAAVLPPEPSPPIHNYLKGAEPAQRCGAKAESGEIIVCGKQQLDAQYRLVTALPSSAETLLPRAEVGVLGNGKIELNGSSLNMGQAASNRMMLTFTKPF